MAIARGRGGGERERAGYRFGGYLELPGVIAASGTLPCEGPHRHYAMQIVVAREGRFVFSSGRERRETGFAVARSGLEHAFEGRGADCLTLFVEPRSEIGRLLGEGMDGCRFFIEAVEALRRAGPEPGPDAESAAVAGGALPPSATAAAVDGLEALLERFSLCDAGLGSVHTEAAKQFIDRNLAAGLGVDPVAERVGLSLSRLQHVFKADMGISMKRYMLWRRLVAGLEGLHGGASLVDAALEAGFSDSAHFSRSCADMLGLAPSSYVKAGRAAGA